MTQAQGESVLLRESEEGRDVPLNTENDCFCECDCRVARHFVWGDGRLPALSPKGRISIVTPTDKQGNRGSEKLFLQGHAV